MFVVVFLMRKLIDEISIDYGTITQFNDVDDLEKVKTMHDISFVV